MTAKKPNLEACVVISSADGKTKTWRRIGAAWKNSDGKGYTVKLFALPLDGTIALRAPLKLNEDDGA